MDGSGGSHNAEFTVSTPLFSGPPCSDSLITSDVDSSELQHWAWLLGAYYASRTSTLGCRQDGLACAYHIFTSYPVLTLDIRMSLQSALIGFLMSKFFPHPITAQENIVLQTTAVATGTVRAHPLE